LGGAFVLALPGCHLHVVHGVSTPNEEAKNSPFVHSENSIAYSNHKSLVRGSRRSRPDTTYILRTYRAHSRGGAGEAQVTRLQNAHQGGGAVSGVRMTVKSVAEFSESWGAEISKSGCDVWP